MNVTRETLCVPFLVGLGACLALVAAVISASTAADDFAVPRRCGILVSYQQGDEHCLALAVEGFTYWLDDYDHFGLGDSVLVLGRTDEGSAVRCGFTLPLIRVATITACRGFDFGCGTITYAGEACRYFDSWLYGLYFFDSIGGYAIGDTVHVVGELQLTCASPCLPDGCISTESVAVCSDSSTAVKRTTLGKLRTSYR